LFNKKEGTRNAVAREGRRAKAGDETRTRDIFLGKEVLYQLSYTRAKMKDPYLAPGWTRFKFFFDLLLSGKCCRLNERPSRKDPMVLVEITPTVGVVLLLTIRTEISLRHFPTPLLPF
jgi:hypothetical protein